MGGNNLVLACRAREMIYVGSNPIGIRTCRMGHDIVFLVTGGTAHIGAAAIAYMSPDGSLRADVLSMPGHREGELAAELAKRAASVLGCTVAVLIGIHLDRPTKQEIEKVVAETQRNMSETLGRWQHLGDTYTLTANDAVDSRRNPVPAPPPG